MFTLLEPDVVRQKITKNNYNTLPGYLLPYVSNYDYIYLVTITPRAETDPTTPCRVVVIASYGDKTGTLHLNNNGRNPSTTPPAGQDDLRPASFYAWGNGTQVFKVRSTTNTSIYINSPVVPFN